MLCCGASRSENAPDRLATVKEEESKCTAPSVKQRIPIKQDQPFRGDFASMSEAQRAKFFGRNPGFEDNLIQFLKRNPRAWQELGLDTPEVFTHMGEKALGDETRFQHNLLQFFKSNPQAWTFFGYRRPHAECRIGNSVKDLQQSNWTGRAGQTVVDLQAELSATSESDSATDTVIAFESEQDETTFDTRGPLGEDHSIFLTSTDSD